MNSAIKAAQIISSKGSCFHLRTTLFHSTPVLERKRRNSWESRSNIYSKRFRRHRKKQTLLRSVSDYADFLCQSLKDEDDEDEPSSSRGPSWFKRQCSAKGSKRDWTGNRGLFLYFQSSKDDDEDDPSSSRGPSWFKRQCSAKGSERDQTGNRGPRRWGRRGFQFCEEDDIDLDTIFQRAFDVNKFSYWSFVNEENPQWRSSSNYDYYGRSWKRRHWNDEENPQWRSSSNYDYYGRSWKWRHQNEETYSSSESESSELDMVSDRLALGLNASGPLKLEDVKIAYRSCALKWHPDRHQGSSKAVAEEKFKLCSAAYQSLCDKLALN